MVNNLNIHRDFFAEFDGNIYHRDLNGIFIQQIV